MDYIPLGRSGLQISRLVLGCSTFGELVDEAGVREIVDRADALGISTFDTANVYAGGQSETLLGRALKGRRNRFVIAGTHDLQARQAAVAIGHPQGPYQLPGGHAGGADGTSPRATVGSTEPPAGARASARTRSATVGFSAMQVMFNLLLREPERELLPACNDSGVGVLAYSALAAGFLTGRHTPTGGLAAGSLFAARRVYQDTYWNEANHERLRRLREWPPGQDQSVAQLALAWVLSHPAVTAAIVGCQHAEELDELVAVSRLSGALHAELTACVG